MIIGVPKEIKNHEYRVAIVPAGVRQLIKHGHRVIVETGAGNGSGFADKDYIEEGAEIAKNPREVYDEAQMIVKVKEPLEPEFPLIKPEHIVFTYFHFASSKELTEKMMQTGAVCIAYETVETEDGYLPLLTPMSEVAGRLAVQEGAKYLERPFGGRGILLGGVAGVEPANVLILGGGAVGTNAAKMAAGLGAKVTILDISIERLRYLNDIMPPN
ncbi:MAG: alanine dehydrogenase, partial [Candidatus Sumerlaeia bacterium]|nr:alanine dehydrogenase [Candidatus Sumerlaeia bacterium]